jgi:hypothetical protein
MEFCLMMLDVERYSREDISKYIPFIESCLTFFDEHYQKEALLRGRQALDGDGKLILYPSTGAETYKMAYNSTSCIAGLGRYVKTHSFHCFPRKRGTQNHIAGLDLGTHQ